MNNKELLLVAEAVSKEQGLSKEEVLTALAEGMETALRRDFPEGSLISVEINEDTGEIKAFRLFELVDQIENVEAQMLNSEVDDEIVSDGYLFEPFDFKLDRQKFNITKQVAMQKLKQGSRDHKIEELLDKNIALFNGIVKVVKKEQIIVDCNGLDITLFRKNLLPRDNYKNGDKAYFTLEKEKNNYVGTRISDQYLIEVFKREIPQIEDGEIDIVSIARIPGFRSKIVVKSNVRNLDAVKTCIGSKASHIKSIQNFVNGEFLDIIEYNENPAQLLIKAFEPVNVTNIVMDEDTNTMDIGVADEDISKAIGKGGKNIELISKLIGWQLNVVSQTEWKHNEALNDHKIAATFEAALGCDNELALILIAEGFSSLEEIAYVPRSEFVIDGLDDEAIDTLRQNAKDTLGNPLALQKAKGAGDLIGLGFSFNQMEILQKNEIYGNDEVADLATFELVDLLTDLDEDKAQHIIIEARKHDVRFQEDNTITA